ncbi:hypothetical protein E6H18_08010 [Candidatus Bathyarchaeota archaeon]|nr:MAG: hypothetical protein E6H18_08010 [Candidatus Bathyarchaeota archaeon]
MNIIPVHAVLGSGNYWSAYGPRTDNLLYKVYNDFSGVFTDFNSGQLDITDWPIQPADLAGFINNPDSGAEKYNGGHKPCNNRFARLRAGHSIADNYQYLYVAVPWRCVKEGSVYQVH